MAKYKVEVGAFSTRFIQRHLTVYAKDEVEAKEKAVELYCKASFDFQGKGEQYQKSYEALRDSLSLSGEYKL